MITPTSITKDLSQVTQLLVQFVRPRLGMGIIRPGWFSQCSLFCTDPTLRFSQAPEDYHDQKRGEDSDEKEQSPAGDSSELGLRADDSANHGTGNVADGGQRLQHAQAIWSRSTRHDFRDERYPGCEFAA